MQIQIKHKQLSPKQISKTSTGMFVDVNARAVVVCAALMYYDSVHEDATFMEQLTIANNMHILNEALARLRKAEKFSPEGFANMLKQLRKDVELQQQYALGLLAPHMLLDDEG